MEEQLQPPSTAGTASPLSSDALRELRRRAADALLASREQAVRLEADITRQLDEIATALSDQMLVHEQSTTDEARKYETEIARLTEELDVARRAAVTDRESLEHERDALAIRVEELAIRAEELEASNRAAQDEWRNQLLDFEAKLRDQQTRWNEQRTEWSIVRTAHERERDELQTKFKLALEDVQRLRERVAELEHDLARRPESAQADSTELVALRAERDALSERVEELEQCSAMQSDPASEQHLSDLQRRFELAVEDVRELKTKNAKLESQLAAAGDTRSVAAPDAGGMDWESQKRRLLASLDEGEDTTDALTRQERVTIEGTIEMTDAVIAEKDEQIAVLTAELDAARNNPSGDESRSEKLSELFDSDEVIAQHRQRSQQLEREMEEKLRAAELEISVERAKLARQKAELEELRTNLDAQRQSLESTGGTSVPGAPRRRWLSKLGIDGKEKE